MSSTFADKSGRGILLAAINKAAKAGFVFTPSDITFSQPEVVDISGKDTKVVYTANANSKFEGAQDAFFNRLDLTGIFTAAGIDTVEVLQSAVTADTSAAVVAAVNARYSLGFTAEDILDEAFEPGVTSVTLNANPLSHGYAGQLLVQLVEGKTPLAEVVVDPVLSGPSYPTPVPVYLTDVVFGDGEVTQKGQKEDGKMLIGTGNPSGDLFKADNGEIELAVGARRYRDINTFPPVDGKYTFDIADDADWNFPFSVALLQEDRPVTELYDVTLSIGSDATSEIVEFTLHRDDEGGFHFVNEALGLDINDSAADATGSVVQNIQRVTFYKEHLGAVVVNGAGAPVGDYHISLKAVRREGLVPAVEAAIMASVSVTQPA